MHNPYREELIELNPEMSPFFKLENVILTVVLDIDSVITIAARWLVKPKALHFDQKTVS